jgi:hypothetical protein
MFLTFDGPLQARQSFVPLTGDAIETATRLMELVRLELPQSLAANANVADQTGPGKNVQVFGDRLPRNLDAIAQARDGQGPAGAEAGYQMQPGSVAKRCEYKYRVRQGSEVRASALGTLGGGVAGVSVCLGNASACASGGPARAMAGAGTATGGS